MSTIEQGEGLEADFASRTISQASASTLTPTLFFEQYRKVGQPVVLRGLLEPQTLWTLEDLCEQLGDRSFPIRHYGWERYQQDKRQWTSMGSGVATQMMAFADYVELLQNGAARQNDLYLGKCSLQGTLLSNTTVLQQVETQLGLQQPVTAANLWLGVGGHTTCLHCDPFDGTLIQLQGQKRLVLFPPSQLPNLYPFPVLGHLRDGLKRRSSYSQVYPDRPDFTAFPNFRQALHHRYEVVLQPGDVLFIPVGWWHEVTALGDGIVCSVNRFWSVLPRSRALQSWNKWRIHLGSLLAAPHIVWMLMKSLGGQRQENLKKLWMRI